MSDENHNKEIKVKVGTKSKTIHVDYLARVEGEGSLYIKAKENAVEEVQSERPREAGSLNVCEQPQGLPKAA